VTERKPTGRAYESWIDVQIRDGMERGDFDNLPGSGQPIAGIGDVSDDLWWVKQKLKRENISFLPGSLVLRKEAEDAREAASRATSEAEVRRIVTAINVKIRDAIRKPPSGPPLNLMPFDVERVVAGWRSERQTIAQPEPPVPEPPRSPYGRWWRRTRRSPPL
jgi:Domain of unknown function (DUF1992)